MICTNCGCELPPTVYFCTNCGAPVSPAEREMAYEAQQPNADSSAAYPPPGNYPPPYEMPYGTPSPQGRAPQDAPSFYNFLIWSLLACIPVVGFIISLVWAFDSQNMIRANFFRASLVGSLIVGAVLGVLIGIPLFFLQLFLFG